MLTGVTHGMTIMKEEVFGPVLSIVKIHSDEEAVALANECDFGLGSNVFGSKRRALKVGAQLNAGMTTINDFCATYMAQSLPFGGVKESGFDRFAGAATLSPSSWTVSRVSALTSLLRCSTPCSTARSRSVRRCATCSSG